MEKQLYIIGGGETFDSREAYLDFLKNSPYLIDAPNYSWKSWLALGVTDTHRVIRPSLPNPLDADYDAWQISFERYLDHYCKNSQQDDILIQIIAHSLGGIFITKYLTENTFPRHIHSLHLIAPVLDNTGLDPHGSLGNFLFDIAKIRNMSNQIDAIHIWYSEDDPIVPPNHSLRYAEELPDAKIHAFTDRGHFATQANFIELFTQIILESSGIQ